MVVIATVHDISIILLHIGRQNLLHLVAVLEPSFERFRLRRAGHGPYLLCTNRSLYILALLSVKWASLVFNTFDIIYRVFFIINH